MDRFAWMDRAQCVLERMDKAPEPGVWQVCKRCDVAAECVAWAETSRDIDIHDAMGLIARGRPRSNPPCGTNAGYRAHRRRLEPRCEACTNAHRLYQERWRAGR